MPTSSSILDIEKSVTANMLAAGLYGLREASGQMVHMTEEERVKRIYAEMEYAKAQSSK